MHVLTVAQMEEFTTTLFDQEGEARKAARILSGILQARSLRLTEIAQALPARPRPTTRGCSASYRRAIPRRMHPLCCWTLPR